MTGMWASLSTFINETWEAANPTPHQPLGHIEAGSKGEIEVLDALKSQESLVPLSNWLAMYHDVRIPHPKGGHREVDVVALTSRAVVVMEIKNWSGSVDVEKRTGNWLQRRRSTGCVVNHENPLLLIRMKADLIREHLERAGVSIPIVHRLVLVNSNLENIHTSIASAEEVVLWGNSTLQKRELLNDFAQSTARTVWESIAPAYFTGSITKDQWHKANQVLLSFPTWDTVTLHGGKVLNGDFKTLRVGGKEHCFQETPRCGSLLVFSHSRMYLTAAISNVVSGGPIALSVTDSTGKLLEQLYLKPSDSVAFRVAGESYPATYSANEVQTIRIGK